MLSVIIPTLNAEQTLPRTLACLVPAAVAGLVREVVIADGGSQDHTSMIADDTGANFLNTPPGRGAQLRAGAARARHDWLLFLHADTVLEPGWVIEVETFIARIEQTSGAKTKAAAVFRFAVEDFGPAARRREWLVKMRCSLLGLPYGDQGLLIHRHFYHQLGGYADAPLLEDVDMVRRIGRNRLIYLRSAAICTDVHHSDNAKGNTLRNFIVLMLHALRVPTSVIGRFYS